MRAWAQFRTSQSPIDYVRVSGMGVDPMLVNAAWQRIDAAARAGHEGAVRLESFFVGQVVGSFEQIRPAGEITRQIVAACEQRIRDLAKLEAGS